MYQTLHSASTVFTIYLGIQLKILYLYSKTLLKLFVSAKAVQKEQVQNKPGTASALEQLRAKAMISKQSLTRSLLLRSPQASGMFCCGCFSSGQHSPLCPLRNTQCYSLNCYFILLVSVSVS